MLEDYGTPEANRLSRYYVQDRHIKLPRCAIGGTPGTERAEFGLALAQDAAAITDADLDTLLAWGWRERAVAAWLVAVDGRTAYRERLGEQLLAGKYAGAGQGHCTALALFGEPADAELLTAYLDHYLAQPKILSDQPWALGALMLLDANHHTERASRYLTEGGLWDQWVAEGPGPKNVDADTYLLWTRQCRDFVRDARDLRAMYA
ncbi:DUF6000 family protein [Yinghuangia seranimata]|uniref:DUF6000 family protein n=1 Tax=Yinghuangia seranimata TaxID=408067 RepID=UPI00248C4382|nr:DUF6000 family protein [Yinghuangia seranimata]MDI2125725.1 DUF6000 family protein [Yinghuangia seranimata]